MNINLRSIFSLKKIIKDTSVKKVIVSETTVNSSHVRFRVNTKAPFYKCFLSKNTVTIEAALYRKKY